MTPVLAQIDAIAKKQNVTKPNVEIYGNRVKEGLIHYSFFFFFSNGARTQDLCLEPQCQPTFVLGIYERGPHEQVAQTGFKPQSS
jgi:hypothetical protein